MPSLDALAGSWSVRPIFNVEADKAVGAFASFNVIPPVFPSVDFALPNSFQSSIIIRRKGRTSDSEFAKRFGSTIRIDRARKKIIAGLTSIVTKQGLSVSAEGIVEMKTEDRNALGTGEIGERAKGIHTEKFIRKWICKFQTFILHFHDLLFGFLGVCQNLLAHRHNLFLIVFRVTGD